MFFKWANPASFSSFLLFSSTNFTGKNVLGFSRIRTRIVGVEGKHADHYTTTTAQPTKDFND